MWGFRLGLGKSEVAVDTGSETQLWESDEGE